MSAEGRDKKVVVLPPMYDFIKEVRQAFRDIQHSTGGHRDNGGPADQTKRHIQRKYNITEPMVLSVLWACTAYLACESPGHEPAPYFRKYYTSVYSDTERDEREITWVKHFASMKLKELTMPPYTTNWSPVLQRTKDFPDEAKGAFIFDANKRYNYPSVLHGILDFCLESDVMMRNVQLTDGLVTALAEAFPEACEIQPLPLHGIVEILVQGKNAFTSANDVSSVLDKFPKALVLSNSVPEEFNRDNVLIKWDGVPLERVATLGTYMRGMFGPVNPPDSFGSCLNILQKFTHNASHYYKNLFTWKPNGIEPFLVQQVSDMFQSIYIMDPSWSKHGEALVLEFLRCTSEAQFGLEYCDSQKRRYERVDPLLIFTALEYQLHFDFVAAIVTDVPGSVRGRHPESGCSPLSLACSTKTSSLGTLETHVEDDTILDMIDIDPSALRLLDNRGRLPLHLAVEGDRDVGLIQSLVEREPRALKTPDGLTKLYPFQLAAVGNKSGHPVNEGEWQLDVIYTLLRKAPLLANGLVAKTPWERYAEGISKLKKERDDWKKRAETYEAENKELKAKLAAAGL